jgi:hypothetical protein
MNISLKWDLWDFWGENQAEKEGLKDKVMSGFEGKF